MDQSIPMNVSSIQEELSEQVILIAVTKTTGIEKIQEAIQAGIRHIGENRVQEAESKWLHLQDENIIWHLIGHLQKNKVAKALTIFDWIQSVDSLELAKRINRIASELNKKPKILLQVKMVRDENKFGFNSTELLESITELDELEHVNIQGLMTIAPFSSTTNELHQIFESVRKLAEDIKSKYLKRIKMNHLSMGMSGDYKIALQEGATMIRLGQKIFGSRV